ncbi:hypothetical protein, partial [Enterococcus faecalis]|uniref:hypothetical protein n=1 Tax=Enterococcus faecalis TaxID=1351 RepID=UPI003D6BFA98
FHEQKLAYRIITVVAFTRQIQFLLLPLLTMNRKEKENPKAGRNNVFKTISETKKGIAGYPPH